MSGLRKEPLVTGEIYHLFNRSNAKEQVFKDENDLLRAVGLLDFYRYLNSVKFSSFLDWSPKIQAEYLHNIQVNAPMVTVYGFSVMPTHFHLLVRQEEDGGISRYLADFQNSYAKYFNKRNDRNGSMFAKPFKSKRVTSDAVFMHVSRYIHINPVSSSLVRMEELETYPWTSSPDYLLEKEAGFVDTRPILGIVGSKEKYREFIGDQASYQRSLELIKHIAMDL